MYARLFLLLACCCLLSPSLALATQAALDNVKSYPLQDFMQGSTEEQIRLNGVRSEYRLTLPLAERVRLEAVYLELFYVNSIALTPRSQLSVWLNDRVVTQLPLRAKAPEGKALIALPVDYFRADYNELRFEVAQHYTAECEDPRSPELWTQIDSERSRLMIRADLRRLNPSLADIPALFDRKAWGEQALTILTPKPKVQQSADAYLQAGALVAQGSALYFDYLPLAITHQFLPLAKPFLRQAAAKPGDLFPGLNWHALPPGDLVLISDKVELNPYLHPSLTQRIDEGFLGIYPRADDPRHVLLVISGDTLPALLRASQVFALQYAFLPKQSELLISDLNFPALNAYLNQQLLPDNERLMFAEFGFESQTMKGVYPPAAKLRFRAPPDWFAPDSSRAQLKLHLAYGAGLSVVSTLNVFLNDRFQHAVHLDDTDGAVLNRYSLELPLKAFHPGWNELSFQARLVPAERAGACEAEYSENLLLSLFEDSVLQLDKAANLALLPDLGRFSSLAYPFNDGRAGEGVNVAVPSFDSSSLGAAWTLLAKMAQLGEQAWFKARFNGRDEAAQERHQLVVGQFADLDDALRAELPFQLDHADWYRAAVATQWQQTQESTLPWWERWLMNFTVQQALDTEVKQASLSFANNEEIWHILSQVESPWEAGKVAVVLTAQESQTLASATHDLVQASHWYALQDHAALWRQGDETLQTWEGNRHFSVGSGGPDMLLSFWFSKFSWLWVLVVLGVLSVFGWLTYLILRRHMRRYHE